MAKKAAVVAVNPVNGMGLFQYLETFFENKIPCTVFAVAESREIRTNSGIEKCPRLPRRQRKSI